MAEKIDKTNYFIHIKLKIISYQNDYLNKFEPQPNN